jgi:spore coat polysaccharide biosynthesis protein SpsF (cytidylyltransferase family)
MNIGAIVQVRMNSKRFPGKALHNILGKPLLQYLIERLRYCKGLNEIIVATSNEKTDRPIVEFCKEQKIECYCGSLSNVAERFYDVLKRNRFKAFVRVCGDSPLIDQNIINTGIDIFTEGAYDIVTNTLVRTYPSGQSVEILRSDTFCSTYPLMKEDDDLEHVTKYFYKHKDDFKIFNMVTEENYEEMKLSVDTEDDMVIMEKIISRMVKPHFEYGLKDIYDIYNRIK